MIVYLLERLMLIAVIVLGFYHGMFNDDYAKGTYSLALAILYSIWCVTPSADKKDHKP